MKDENGIGNDYEKMKCIWMSSNVVDYKLCDNHFNCESCLFDKVMRNLLDGKTIQPKGAVDLISGKLQRLKFDDKMICLKNNFIAKTICRDTFYLGLNPVLTSFLDDSSSLEMHEPGKKITAGEQLLRIYGTWGNIALTSPADFLIYEKVGDPEESPWKSRWIAIIGGDHNKVLCGGLSKTEWEEMHRNAVDAIGKVKTQKHGIGETMFDGGNRVESLHQMLGNKKYYSILKTVAGLI